MRQHNISSRLRSDALRAIQLPEVSTAQVPGWGPQAQSAAQQTGLHTAVEPRKISRLPLKAALQRGMR